MPSPIKNVTGRDTKATILAAYRSLATAYRALEKKQVPPKAKKAAPSSSTAMVVASSLPPLKGGLAGQLSHIGSQIGEHTSGLQQQLTEALSGLIINEAPKAQSPHILNISFEGVDGEALRADLDQLAVSSGSACTSDHAEPSYVLRALGRSDSLADASLRFSFGYGSSEAEIDQAAQMVIASVRRLRRLSPLWSEAA